MVRKASAFSLEDLFKCFKFKPNDPQLKAIQNIDGPLFLTAGPGSGKTRVILWRTLNLIVFHDVKPEEIFLATFTEKAALQLKQGLQSMLSEVSTMNGQPYDIGRMYIGTLHSLCQKILSDRNFNPSKERVRRPILMDALDQYQFVYNRQHWDELIEAGKWASADSLVINESINNTMGAKGQSRTEAVKNVIALFNRLSEEDMQDEELKSSNSTEKSLFKMYKYYKKMLNQDDVNRVDLALLQQKALNYLNNCPNIEDYIKYVIVDEYQDTNTIQEKIYFKLAKKTCNICVVGDDDQALYRFRGATVENLVDFASRCQVYLGREPERVDLNINYRSRKNIVDVYTKYIECENWQDAKNKQKFYRIQNKNIKAHSRDNESSVFLASGDKDSTVESIIKMVKCLRRQGKITDYNQCAFLFPSLTSKAVALFMEAMDAASIPYYAPRAKNFFYTEECLAVFGLMSRIFEPKIRNAVGPHMENFEQWLKDCHSKASEIIEEDVLLNDFIEEKKTQIAESKKNYKALLKKCEELGLGKSHIATPEITKNLSQVRTISDSVKRTLIGAKLNNFIIGRAKQNRPVSVGYVLSRVTALDWTILDLFYQLNCFEYFLPMFENAETGQDEGPMFNLGMITQYLAKFNETHNPILSGSSFIEDGFVHQFWNSFLYSLLSQGVSEYEDADDPFPKGRIPFLTVHQSKGLEFPVVVLGSVRRNKHDARPLDVMVRKLRKTQDGEPLDRMDSFDTMRMFYVALSRAKNLLVLTQFTGRGQATSDSFKKLFDNVEIPDLKKLRVSDLPVAGSSFDDIPKVYSYTADYLPYLNCPRNYMIFHKYGFVPSRSQTMIFGSLVHQTIDDLQQLINSQKEAE